MCYITLECNMIDVTVSWCLSRTKIIRRIVAHFSCTPNTNTIDTHAIIIH